MSLQIADSFELLAQKPLDERQQFDTLEEMRDYKDYNLAEGLIAFNTYDFKTYQFKSTNTFDSVYGKWREFGSDNEILKINSLTLTPDFGEKGITQTVNINWEFNKKIKSQKIVNNTTSAEALNDATGLIRTLPVSLSEDTNFTLTAVDMEGNSVTETVAYKAVHPVYSGVIAGEIDFAALTETDITTNLVKTIHKDNKATWENITFEFSTPILAVPSSFGELTSIIDQHGLEYIKSYEKHDMTINSVPYYIYIFNNAITLLRPQTFFIS